MAVINTDFDRVELPPTDLVIPADVEHTKVETIRMEIEHMLDVARSLVITNEKDYQTAGSIGLECTRRISRVEEELEESRAAADATHKAITRLIVKLTNPYKQIKTIVGQKASDWYQDELRKRREEADKARRAEQKRIDDEKLAKAEALAEAGDTEMAEAVLEEKTIISAPKVEAPKVEGMSHRARWTAEVVDFRALVKAVAEGKTALGFLLPNEQALRAQAQSLKAACSIPGVRVYDAGGTAFRG
jgi:hypothetical protein